MRILITNDDGVFAPGIEALARGLENAYAGQHELVVVAPLSDHSGAGAAIGTVYERESIPYESVQIPGLEHVPTFGVDGPPALAALLACIEGFGPRPDLVVSGVNNGMNVGRSALHSGTVGAALTAAQFGVRGIAVSIRWSAEPVHWETPVTLAQRLVPVVAAAGPGIVLNLNTPAVPLRELRGVRHGRLAGSGLVRSARSNPTVDDVRRGGTGATGGVVLLSLASGRGATGAEPDTAEAGSDSQLVESGWASVTPLAGVHEDASDDGADALAKALAELGPA